MLTHPIPPPYPLVILFAVCLHLTWGVMYLIDPNIINVTGIHDLGPLLGGWFPWIVITVGLAALLPLVRPIPRFWTILAMIPQQMFLTISAGTAITAMYCGCFADGVLRSHAFLIADQMPIVLAATFHTIAILGNVWDLPWKI